MTDGAPEVVVYTEDGWWMKWREDRNGWLWKKIDCPPVLAEMEARRFTELPRVVETYQPSAILHALSRGGKS